MDSGPALHQTCTVSPYATTVHHYLLCFVLPQGLSVARPRQCVAVGGCIRSGAGGCGAGAAGGDAVAARAAALRRGGTRRAVARQGDFPLMGQRVRLSFVGAKMQKPG